MSTKNKKNVKKQEKKGINIFFVIIEFALIAFTIASFSMGLPLLGVFSIALAVFITSFPNYVLERLGKEPINRNVKFLVAFAAFIILCYMVPDSKIKEVNQRQVENMKQKIESEETAESSETGTLDPTLDTDGE